MKKTDGIALKLLRLLSIILAFSAIGYSQSWSGVIAPPRAIDWSQAGTAVPARSVTCATFNPGATATQINNAIAACPSNQVVYLNPGTYTLSAGINFAQKSNVTVRGAGPNKTFLVFTGAGDCNGQLADVCIAGGNSYPDGADHYANWTAGYAQGTTSITLSNSLGIVANTTLINLDQLDETSDTGNIWNCLAAGVCSDSGSSGSARGGNRSQQQEVLVTGCSPSCNSSGSTVVTISPGLYMPNWRSGQSPGAWWANVYVTQDGIENISLDHTNSPMTSGILIDNCYQCWVKGVRSLYANRNHVWLYQSSHVVVRDSYFYQSQNHLDQSYGIELQPASSDNLIENNIFDSDTDSNPNSNGGGAGNVAGYNFTVQTFYTSPGWFQASDYDHASGQSFWLREGNQGTGFTADNIHGNHHLTTLFRNYYKGWQSSCFGAPCALQTIPIQIYAASRYFNIIGNVLGTGGYHNSYQSLPPSGTNGETSIFVLGWTDNGGVLDPTLPNFCLDSTCASHVDYDSLTYNTLMRWGNYDVVNNAVRWQASEVPSTLSLYANPVPASQTLPASFYLAGKPSWWPSTVPFPANGPDVTGGNISGVGGHANNIPAEVCFSNAIGTPITFNPASCYGPPNPGSPGTITVSNISGSAMTLTWAMATDGFTPQPNLQYEVVLSASNNIDTLAHAAGNGTVIQFFTPNIATFTVTGLTPSTTYYFNVIVQDQAGNQAAYGMTSGTTGVLTVSPATLQTGVLGIPYSETITASGGTGPYKVSLSTGSLPAGLTLASTGLLSGTPSSPGSVNFTVTITDSASPKNTSQWSYNLIITGDYSSNIALTLNAANFDSAPSPGAVGTYTLSVTITNNGPALSNPVFFQVTQLNKVGTDLNPAQPDVLITADNGLGKTGDIQSLGFSNGLPSHSPIEITFQIAIGSRQKFIFTVSLFAYLPQIRKADAKMVELKTGNGIQMAPRLLKTLTLQVPDLVSGAPPSFSNVGVITDPGSRSRPAVAVDPHLSRRMAVAANDTSGNVIVSMTDDGGSTWHSTAMSRSIGGVDFFNAQDPSVAFDSKGKLSVVYVLSNLYDAANAIVIAESIDGVNFSPPSTITFHNPEDNVIDSRPVIAIGSGSRYVAWENFGSSINVALSGEDGIFGSPVTVVSGAQVCGPSIAIGGQTVYIGWDEWGFNSRPPYITGGRLMTASTPVAAQLTFSTPQQIATTNIGFSSSRIPMLPAARGVSTNLHLAVHPRNENLLYAVFVDKQDSLDVRFAWSFDRGTSWDGMTLNSTGSGGDQFSPAMYIDGHGNVHVSFYDTLQKQATTGQVFLASSSTTYSSPPQRLFNLCLEQPAPADVFTYRQITTLPIDESKTNQSGGIATNLGDRTAIAVSSENILIAWTDTREKKEDVYVSILPICDNQFSKR